MGRHGGPAAAGPTAPSAVRAKAVNAPSQVFVRIAILAALLLLAVYTSLTKSLITMHDGVLEMHSTPGEGTTVSFTLPVRHSDQKITRDLVAA